MQRWAAQWRTSAPLTGMQNAPYAYGKFVKRTRLSRYGIETDTGQARASAQAAPNA